MKKTITIAMLFLSGCGWNPFAPNEFGDYSSFESFMDDMDSPERVARWMIEDTTYDEKKSTGKGEGADDVERYARFMYEHKSGACMQQACTFVYANRWHGYEAGIVIIFPRPNSYMAPHAMSWFIGKSGKTSMTSNDHVSRDIYNSVKNMFDKFVESDNELVVYDGKMEKVLYSRFREATK